jgi:hypothetical protein
MPRGSGPSPYRLGGVSVADFLIRSGFGVAANQIQLLPIKWSCCECTIGYQLGQPVVALLGKSSRCPFGVGGRFLAQATIQQLLLLRVASPSSESADLRISRAQVPARLGSGTTCYLAPRRLCLERWPMRAERQPKRLRAAPWVRIHNPSNSIRLGCRNAHDAEKLTHVRGLREH